MNKQLMVLNIVFAIGDVLVCMLAIVCFGLRHGFLENGGFCRLCFFRFFCIAIMESSLKLTCRKSDVMS